jgi:N-acetylmuramoyl-L-alanine amidase
MSGELYSKLYKLSLRESDRKEAIDIFERIVKQFPKSKYKGNAIKKIRAFSKKEKKKSSKKIKVSTKKKSLSEKKKLKKDIKPSKTNKVVTITGLRYWSNPSYTRIVIDADNDTTYNHRLLRKDPSIQKPKRLYVDLDNSRLEDGIIKKIPIHDVWGTEAKRKTSELKTAEKDKKFTTSALAKQLSLGVNRIVIDPGHGGRDRGAI